MEQTTYASRLRYLDADDVDDSVVDFTGLDVRGVDGSSLGDLDGFLVDATSGRVLYTVVDSRGWFTSRRVLVPIGHATVDRQKGALCLDVARETLRNYPAFDESRFREFSDEDFRTYEQRMAEACCPDDLDETSAATDAARRHFTQPAWWTAGAYSVDRLRPVESRPYRGESTKD
ncbi:MAG: PRC-barrel domain-containing protein [Acidobacteria bacterium]|nr:PRC-barrel domain-containing protein [Acidobacteriota bacterium]